MYKRVTEFAVWRNKLEHHENVDFQRLRGAVSSYHQSRIRLLRHVGLTLLVIAFLARLFSVTECLFFLLFVRKEGRLVGKALEHIAPLTFTYLFTGDKLKKCECIILNSFINIKKTQLHHIYLTSVTQFILFTKKEKEQYKFIKLHSTCMYLQSTILYQTLGQNR